MTTVSSGTTNFSVDLVGSATNNTSLLNFEIVDGSDCIDIIYNNNICSVTPKSEGSALIKVTHPECEVSLDVRVIVVDTKLLPIISTDKPFLELTSTMDSFTCTVLNSDVVDKDYKYSLGAQILNVADKYSALTEKRVYKEALPKAEALKVIHEEVEKGLVSEEVFNALAKAV